jgi:hypothetical protein
MKFHLRPAQPVVSTLANSPGAEDSSLHTHRYGPPMAQFTYSICKYQHFKSKNCQKLKKIGKKRQVI